MTKYIESEAVIELFNKWADGYSYIEVPTKDAIACVRAIPAADAIEELTDRNVGKWIPVTERLPKAERESYWVYTDTGYQCEARWTNNVFGCHYSSHRSEWGWSIADVSQYCKVTHWMPLPEPPKEE